MDLLVLAAGMGSRFGGLKQVEPVGPNGEVILDYSVYDAIKAGFKKVVFIIKKENLSVFEENVGKRLRRYVEIDYAFQDIKDTPITVDVERLKPWGTVQAILCAKNKIDDNFAVINADDFYGRDAFYKAYDELVKLNADNKYSAVLYEAKGTLSANGKVKRGICITKDGNIKNIIESSVYEKDNKLMCEPLDGSNAFESDLESLVSMNMFLFNKSVFPLLEVYFKKFLETTGDLSKDESLISTFVDDMIKEGVIDLKYVSTNSKWYGITFREDLDEVKEGILKLIQDDVYQNDLWG